MAVRSLTPILRCPLPDCGRRMARGMTRCRACYRAEAAARAAATEAAIDRLNLAIRRGAVVTVTQPNAIPFGWRVRYLYHAGVAGGVWYVTEGGASWCCGGIPPEFEAQVAAWAAGQ